MRIWRDESESLPDREYDGVTLTTDEGEWWKEYSEQVNYWDRMQEVNDRLRKIHPSVRKVN